MKSQIFGQSADIRAVCREVYYVFETSGEGRGGEGKGGGLLGLIFAERRWPLGIPTTLHSLFCGHITDPILVTLGKK